MVEQRKNDNGLWSLLPLDKSANADIYTWKKQELGNVTLNSHGLF